jgi:hypothetical protein
VSFTAEYSLWFTLLCLLLATAGSWFLYRNNPLELNGKYGKIARWSLFAFRFVALFVIAFLLLGPLMKITSNRIEKPLVVLAIDGSQSIVANKDSAFYRNEFTAGIKQLQQNLADDYEVKTYTIGKTVTENFDGSFNERQTNISQVFDELKNNYNNQNLGAVIVATDGLYNEGSNPVYSAKDLHAPVFTVALGDTIQQKDVLIKQVKYNQLVYAGNLFPLQIDVSAFGYNTKQTKLTISHQNQTVFTQNVTINSANFFQTIPVSLEAKQPGTQHYIVTLSSLAGEVSTANNRFDVFINVIDGKQKIALISLAPHPDIAAYKQSIEQNENYSIKSILFDKISPNELKDYSLIIFHQLPGARGEGLNLVKAVKQQNLPVLYVLGAQTGLANLNANEPTINIGSARNMVNEATASVQSSFALFTMSEDELDIIKKFPPLYSPYGNYKINAEHDILLTQQIGYVKTAFPLMAFCKNSGSKVGFICGEGFWKWRINDAVLSQQKVTSSLMGKTVQYLAAKDDRSRFRMNSKKRFDENEPVKLDAEVYNESYELINSSDVQLQVQNSNGKKFTYTFSKTNNAYTLTIGLLPVGNYTYQATTAIGANVQKLSGAFVVTPLQVEFLQTTANHQLLNELATETQGALFFPTQLPELEKSIRANETIKPVIYKQDAIKSWINLKWIFFLVLMMLSAEWFIRKWNGSI